MNFIFYCADSYIKFVCQFFHCYVMPDNQDTDYLVLAFCHIHAMPPFCEFSKLILWVIGARLAVIQCNTIPVVIVAALMYKPTRRPVLAVVHAGAFTVHYPAPFCAPALALKSAQCCPLRSAIPLCVLFFPGTRCKGRFSLW